MPLRQYMAYNQSQPLDTPVDRLQPIKTSHSKMYAVVFSSEFQKKQQIWCSFCRYNIFWLSLYVYISWFLLVLKYNIEYQSDHESEGRVIKVLENMFGHSHSITFSSNTNSNRYSIIPFYYKEFITMQCIQWLWRWPPPPKKFAIIILDHKPYVDMPFTLSMNLIIFHFAKYCVPVNILFLKNYVLNSKCYIFRRILV